MNDTLIKQFDRLENEIKEHIENPLKFFKKKFDEEKYLLSTFPIEDEYITFLTLQSFSLNFEEKKRVLYHTNLYEFQREQLVLNFIEEREKIYNIFDETTRERILREIEDRINESIRLIYIRKKELGLVVDEKPVYKNIKESINLLMKNDIIEENYKN